MGVEITGKTLGVVGCGNIGRSSPIAAAWGGVAYDPFLSPERHRSRRREGQWRLFKRADSSRCIRR